MAQKCPFCTDLPICSSVITSPKIPKWIYFIKSFHEGELHEKVFMKLGSQWPLHETVFMKTISSSFHEHSWNISWKNMKIALKIDASTLISRKGNNYASLYSTSSFHEHFMKHFMKTDLENLYMKSCFMKSLHQTFGEVSWKLFYENIWSENTG